MIKRNGISNHYSIFEARKRKIERTNLEENETKSFVHDLEENEYIQEYLECKRKLNNIFDYHIEGIKIVSKCKCYEEGVQSNKIFMNKEYDPTKFLVLKRISLFKVSART